MMRQASYTLGDGLCEPRVFIHDGFILKNVYLYCSRAFARKTHLTELLPSRETP